MLDLCDGDADGVTRLFADLGADVLKIEPPGGSAARSAAAQRGRGQRSVRVEQRQQAQCRTRSRRRGGSRAGSSTWPRAPTSWWTAAIPVVPRRSARRVRSCRSGIRISSRCRSPTSASTAHGRPGAPPIRCSMRCRRRCRGQGRRPDVRCCRRTASPRPPPRYRRHGRRWSLTTTGCVTAPAITSTSPASKRSCSRSIRRSDRRGRPPSARNVRRVVAWQAPKPADLPDIRLSGRLRQDLPAVATAMAGNASRGWGNRSSSADPKFDTIAARYGASREINALIAELFAAQTMDELVDGGPVARGADRRGAQPGRNPWLRALSVGRRADRRPRSHRAWTLRFRSARSSSTGGSRGFARAAPTVGGDEAGLDRNTIRTTADVGLRQHEPAVRRSADSRSRRDRRGRRTRATVRRSRRRGRSRSRAPPTRTVCGRPRRAR